jgi:5'(3')-deoxyribonucleotidase
MADIGLDVDGVLADLVQGTLDEVAACHRGDRLPRPSAMTKGGVAGTNYVSPAKNDITQWDFKDSMPAQYSLIKEAWLVPDFWAELPCIPRAAELVADVVAAGHNIFFITSPYESCNGWEKARRTWLRESFGGLGTPAMGGSAWTDRRVIFAPSAECKAKVHVDVFVDDKPANVTTWWRYWNHDAKTANAFPENYGLLFDAYYNQDADTFGQFGSGTIGNKHAGWRRRDIDRLLDLADTADRAVGRTPARRTMGVK